MKLLVKLVDRLANVANRLICLHDQYLIDPEHPAWARCVTCGKPKRLN